MASAALKNAIRPRSIWRSSAKHRSRVSTLDGTIVAMAGASREHNLIAANLDPEASATNWKVGLVRRIRMTCAYW